VEAAVLVDRAGPAVADPALGLEALEAAAAARRRSGRC
jgi:hypothetical protein